MAAMKYIFILITLAAIVTVFLWDRGDKVAYYYDAYSPKYDEVFVIKSYSPLKCKETVWFDTNAVVSDTPTVLVAQIQ